MEGPSLQNWDRWSGEEIFSQMLRYIFNFFVGAILLVVLIYNFGLVNGLIYSAIIATLFAFWSFKHDILKFIRKFLKIQPKIKFGKLKT